jgi:SAM-dependent methyltransferase
VASRLVVDRIAECFQHHCATYARGKLLDLGCGKVPLFACYRGHVDEVVCVDWENTPHKCPHLDLQCDLSKRLPFEDGGFDTIVLSDVLEHIPNPWLLWMEMQRVLAPSGHVILSVPFYYWLHERPFDFFRFTEHGLTRLAEDAGLSMVLLEQYGGLPEIFADLLAKGAASLPGLGKPAAILIQGFAGTFRRMPAVGNLSKRSSQCFPFGYFAVAKKLGRPAIEAT